MKFKFPQTITILSLWRGQRPTSVTRVMSPAGARVAPCLLSREPSRHLTSPSIEKQQKHPREELVLLVSDCVSLLSHFSSPGWSDVTFKKCLFKSIYPSVAQSSPHPSIFFSSTCISSAALSAYATLLSNLFPLFFVSQQKSPSSHPQNSLHTICRGWQTPVFSSPSSSGGSW